MSYLVDVIVRKPKSDDEKVPFFCLEGFSGMSWCMSKDEPKEIKRLNKKAIKVFKTPDGMTTIEQLKTAPCDIVVMIDGDTFSVLENRKPIDCSGKNLDIFFKKYTRGLIDYLENNLNKDCTKEFVPRENTILLPLKYAK
jgi:hypothetical protein